jgi:hypothetical protein
MNSMIAFIAFMLFASAFGGRSVLHSGGIYGSTGYGSGYNSGYGVGSGYGLGLDYSPVAYEAPAVSYVARPAAVSYVQPSSYSSYGSGYGLGSGHLGYSAGYNTPSVSSYYVRGNTDTVGATGGLRYASNYAAAPVSYVSSGYGSYGRGYGTGYGSYGSGYGTGYGSYGSGYGTGLTSSYSSGPGYSYSY